jgi:hypothetical protein
MGMPFAGLTSFLFAVGRALRIWPVFVLGRQLSGLVAIQPEHALVTTVSMVSSATQAILVCLSIPAERRTGIFETPSDKVPLQTRLFRCGYGKSEPIAFPCGFDIGGGVSPQQ